MNESDIIETHSECKVTTPDEFHPSYSSPSADIVLLSDDGVKFRVHSLILANASKFFHDMFGIPRSTEETHDDALPMSESSEIVKTLLDIIYPCSADPNLPSVSFEFVQRQEGAIPVRTIGGTLNLDLSSPFYEDTIKRIGPTSVHQLFQLRWKIKEKVLGVVKLLTNEDLEDMWGCYCCDSQTPGNTPTKEDWDGLEMFVRGELDKYPDGSSLRRPGLWCNGEQLRLWNLKCNLCSKPTVRKDIVQEAVIKALDEVNFIKPPS